MPLTDPDFRSIRNMIEKVVQQLVGTRADHFTTGKVIKVDAANKCVYLAEFDDQPVPIVAFDYTVKYYDTNGSGVVSHKEATVILKLPKVGDSVLVAREMGTRRLPRALGVIMGTNWIRNEED